MSNKKSYFLFLKILLSTSQWLTPVLLATQEAEIRRISVQSQPGQIVHETLSRKNTLQKKASGVAQVVGPEFKPKYHTYTQKNSALVICKL
jgi:hypothetical protein